MFSLSRMLGLWEAFTRLCKVVRYFIFLDLEPLMMNQTEISCNFLSLSINTVLAVNLWVESVSHPVPKGWLPGSRMCIPSTKFIAGPVHVVICTSRSKRRKRLYSAVVKIFSSVWGPARHILGVLHSVWPWASHFYSSHLSYLSAGFK